MIRKSGVFLSTISLSFFGISNFYSGIISYIYLSLAIIMLLLITLHIILCSKDFKKSLQNILVQVIFPSYFLSIISLSAIIEKVNTSIGYSLWLITAICYFIFALYFIYVNIIRNFKLDNVIPGWFLVFVGLGNMAIVTPQHNNYLFGQLIFYFSFLIYFILLGLLLYRLKKIGNVKESIRPSYMLLVAGPSVNLVGYFNVYSLDSFNFLIIYGLLFINLIIILLLLLNFKKVFVNKYYPSFVGYTFPIIITSSMYISIIQNLEITVLNDFVIIIKILATTFVTCMSFYILYRTYRKETPSM